MKKRWFGETLQINPFIRTVRQVDVTFEADDLTISCEVETIYGSRKYFRMEAAALWRP